MVMPIHCCLVLFYLKLNLLYFYLVGFPLFIYFLNFFFFVGKILKFRPFHNVHTSYMRASLLRNL